MAVTWKKLLYQDDALGTPISGVLTNCTGTASGLTAGNVTTNANLTGPITSVGNATSIASQTGTGTVFAMQTSPSFATDISTPAIKTTAGALTITPAAGSGLNIALSTTGDFAVNTDDLVVDTSNGAVVIGHTVGIAGASGQVEQFQVMGTAGASASLGFHRYSADNAPPNVRLYKSRGASIGTETVVQDGDIVGRLVAYAYDSAAYISPGYLEFYVDDATVGANKMGGGIRFITTLAGSTTQSTAFDIKNTGNVVIGSTTTTGGRSLQITNTNAGAGAFAQLMISSDAGNLVYQAASTAGGGLASFYTSNTGLNIYTTGNTVLNLGTNNVAGRISVSGAGEVTMPYQPAFLAYNSVTDTNVTGNATDATVDFDTEVIDQGGDFATDTFTAPVTGNYRMSTAVRANELTNATDLLLNLVTSNRTYALARDITGTVAGSGIKMLNGGTLADMDAGDTATVLFRATGIGADTADIFGTTSPVTYFSGELVC